MVRKNSGSGGGGGITAEDALDAVGTALVAGEGIDITVNDGADTITIDAEAASATNAGIIEIATDAEVETGTDTARAITPAGAAAAQRSLTPRKSGLFYTIGATPAGSLAWLVNRMYLLPWQTATGGTVNALAFQVDSVGLAGQVGRVGIYAIDSGGEPTGAPLVDAGTAATDAATGVKVVSTSLAIIPGYYALAIVPQLASGGTIAAEVVSSSLLSTMVGFSSISDVGGHHAGWYMSSVTGALPTISGLELSNVSAPKVGVRFA